MGESGESDDRIKLLNFGYMKLVHQVREVFKNPSNGNFPLRGYPPLWAKIAFKEKYLFLM